MLLILLWRYFATSTGGGSGAASLQCISSRSYRVILRTLRNSTAKASAYIHGFNSTLLWKIVLLFSTFESCHIILFHCLCKRPCAEPDLRLERVWPNPPAGDPGNYKDINRYAVNQAHAKHERVSSTKNNLIIRLCPCLGIVRGWLHGKRMRPWSNRLGQTYNGAWAASAEDCTYCLCHGLDVQDSGVGQAVLLLRIISGDTRAVRHELHRPTSLDDRRHWQEQHRMKAYMRYLSALLMTREWQRWHPAQGVLESPRQRVPACTNGDGGVLGDWIRATVGPSGIAVTHHGESRLPQRRQNDGTWPLRRWCATRTSW